MKKAQFWYGDFLVAVLILMIIGMLFVTSIRDITSRNEILKDLILEASDISSTLMSEGYGDYIDWVNKEGTVGFIKDYKLNSVSLNFLTFVDYNTQKIMLGTFNNVWIYLSDRNGEIIYDNSDKIGIQINSVSDIPAKNLVHMKRFVFWEGDINNPSDIYTLGVVVWQ